MKYHFLESSYPPIPIYGYPLLEKICSQTTEFLYGQRFRKNVSKLFHLRFATSSETISKPIERAYIFRNG